MASNRLDRLDTTERAGLGLAIAAHIILLGLLSFQFGPNDPAQFSNPPMTVDIIAEVAPVATAPEISAAPPAARLGDPDSREASPPPPAPSVPVVRQRPPVLSKVEPVRQPRPTPHAQPQRPSATPAVNPPSRPARDPRPSGALDGIAAGVARDAQRNARAATPPAVQSAAAIRADIRVSINSEVRTPWNACRVSGIDVDQLKTTIVFRLTQSGGLDRMVSVNTAGVNDSNRPQLQRFEECARRAIQLATPFANLPQEHYTYWQTYTLDFEKR